MLPSSDPVKHRHRAPPMLVGRESERVQLRAHLDEALEGRGRMVLVSGEAGIGKTALVSALCHQALERGALVLTGGCYDLTTTPAYGPWIELTRTFPDDPELPPLPDQLRVGGGMASVDSQAALIDLIGRFLGNLAGTRPLVLLLEDLHWADPASLDLLRSVARTLSARPVLLLVTYRDDEPAAEHPFFRVLPALVREAPSYRLALHRLDRKAIQELIRERYPLPTQHEERLVTYLAGLAEGNPFFTLELLYMLVEQRRLTAAGGAWRLGDLTETGIPPLIQQIIGARLSTLDDAARGLLELAAVIGIEAPLDLLQRLFDGTSAELDDVLQQASNRHLLIVPPGQQVVRLSHALVRQAIYEAIPPLRRRQLHREIGDLFAMSHQPDPDVIATHLFHAGDERGIDWLIHAAERAQSLFAAETVIARCSQARDLADRTGRETPVTVYRLQGIAREMTGDFTGARAAHELALTAAHNVSDERAAWQASFDLGNLWASRDYEQSRTYLERALALAREIGAPVLLGRSLNRLGNWYMNAEQPDEGIRYHLEALDIFERVGDQAGTAATLDLLGMARVLAGDADRGAVYYRRAIPLLRALDDRPTLVTALVVSSTMAPSVIPVLPPVHMRQHAPDAGPDWLSPAGEAIGIARDIGWRAGEAFALALTSHTAQVLGDYNLALNLGRQGLDIANEIEHRQWLVTALIAFGETHMHLCALDRAVALLERANAEAQESNSRFLVGYAVALLALTCIARHEPDRAEQLIRPHLDLTQLRESMRQRDYCYILARLELARKHPANALSLLDQLEDAMPGSHSSTSPHLCLVRADALILERRYAEAEPILQDALDTARRFGFRPIIWRILASLRTLYLEQGLLDRAEESRQAALQNINDLVAGLDDDELREGFLTHARAQLPERMPFSPGRSSAANFAGLTLREREVLAFVAQGMTDAQAADQLYISPRTVSQHLRSIYTKLDVANRAAAVRIAMEQNLLDLPADSPPGS